jgi:hypothetical protein
LTTVPLSLFLSSLAVIVLLDVMLIADRWTKPKTRMTSTLLPILPARNHFKFEDFQYRCEGDHVVLCKTLEVEKVLLQITLPRKKTQEVIDHGITVVVEHTDDLLRSLEII